MVWPRVAPKVPDASRPPDRAINLHGLEYDPVGLWQLDGDLIDSSGNGYDLELENGSTPVASDVLGGYFDGSSNLHHNGTPADLRILGDYTAEMLIRFPYGPGITAGPNSLKWLFVHSGSTAGETTAENVVLGLRSRGDNVEGFEHFQEGAAAADSTIAFTDQAFAHWRTYHLACVRAGNDITLYANGSVFDQTRTTSPAAPPTDGASGRFRLGGTGTVSDYFTGWIASFKLIPSALTAAQVRAEVARTIG